MADGTLSRSSRGHRTLLLALCPALLASNAVALLKAALRAEHGQEAVAALSVSSAALDIQQAHRGMRIALRAPGGNGPAP